VSRGRHSRLDRKKVGSKSKVLSLHYEQEESTTRELEEVQEEASRSPNRSCSC